MLPGNVSGITDIGWSVKFTNELPVEKYFWNTNLDWILCRREDFPLKLVCCRVFILGTYWQWGLLCGPRVDVELQVLYADWKTHVHIKDQDISALMRGYVLAGGLHIWASGAYHNRCRSSSHHQKCIVAVLHSHSGEIEIAWQMDITCTHMY